MSLLALPASFEYLCYGSTAITNILILPVRGSSLDVTILRQLYGRQILTSKDGPRAERFNIL